MTDYSQGKEQEVILNYFNNKTGLCLDIGAYDGKTFSNVRALVEKGWQCVMIEADPENAHNAKKNSVGFDVQVLCAAVHPYTDGITKFFSSGGDMVGTTETEHAAKWSSAVTFTEMLVPLVSAKTILDTFGDVFDFISVDVEGMSAELGAVIFERFRYAQMICIEHDGKADELRALAISYRFGKELFYNGENIIFAK